MKVFVINPGATSTKIAVFEESEQLARLTIEHPAQELVKFEKIIDQRKYRRELVLDGMKESGFELSDFDAICSRGGLLRHIPSGTYEVTERVIEDVMNPPYGEHASNLGVLIAKDIADMAGLRAYFSDPVSVDELQPLARISGFKEMERESFFHALNHKGMARRAAERLGRAYEELNLIVLHMGGGVSSAAHRKGRVVDMFNVKDDGAFSMDRAGSLPVNALINYCFSGRTKAEVKKTLGSEAGMYSYLGTKDFIEVEKRALAGDEECLLMFEAFVYQQIKDVGSMAAVLCMDVDAIVLTGGMANSKLLCERIKQYIGKIAPIIILPGEAEMQSLAEGTLRVLHGAEPSVY
ncbi:MAG: butyrate kinase [Clostridiales bacterium]|nr:butyrate kinase [Clostridiales bacterium]